MFQRFGALLVGGRRLVDLVLCFGQCLLQSLVLLEQFVLEDLQLLQLFGHRVLGALGHSRVLLGNSNLFKNRNRKPKLFATSSV